MRKKFGGGGERRFLHLSSEMWARIDALAAQDRREWYNLVEILLEKALGNQGPEPQRPKRQIISAEDSLGGAVKLTRRKREDVRG
jgi:hypothetical protein